MPGLITISRQRISVHIGVPDEERASPQEIEISLEMRPERTLFGTEDEIAKTIDYFSVSQRIEQVAQRKPSKLIEQLNEDLLGMVLSEFPVSEATITTRKFILKNTEYVSVSMTLGKEQA